MVDTLKPIWSNNYLNIVLYFIGETPIQQYGMIHQGCLFSNKDQHNHPVIWAWISIFIHVKQLDVITRPWPNLNCNSVKPLLKLGNRWWWWPWIAMVYHLRRVTDMPYDWKNCLLCYMKDVVLHCSIFFKWNIIDRVRVRVRWRNSERNHLWNSGSNRK